MRAEYFIPIFIGFQPIKGHKLQYEPGQITGSDSKVLVIDSGLYITQHSE